MPGDVRAKFEEWKKRLLDFSARNRLLFFRPTKTGTLDLAGVGIQPLFDTLVISSGQIAFEGQPEGADGQQPTEDLPRVSQSTKGMKLHLRSTDKVLRKTLTNLYRRANQSLLEQGIHTLHMAIGFLEWYEIEHSEQPIRSPLLLVPVQLERQQGGVFVLEPTGEPPEANIVLVEKLRRDLSIQLPEWHQDENEQPDLSGFLAEVRRATADLDRSRVDEAAVLDIFSFAKLVMYKDLERNTEHALANRLIQGICGEPTAGPDVDVPSGEELDRRLRYTDCFHVLDADTSQREAIAAATEGESFILVGPPGTGKSQTIANIIAESMAKGKRVLFVSEKAAALEVVHRRLEECGLHHFCLDLHTAGGKKSKVLEQLGNALTFEAPAPDVGEDYAVLEDERARLNAYAQALHMSFGGLRWTPFEVQSRLTNLSGVADLLVRIDAPGGGGLPEVLSTVDSRRLASMESTMADVQGLADFFQQGEDHPWWGYQYAVSKSSERMQLREYLKELEEEATTAAELCDRLRETWGVTNLPNTIDGLGAKAAVCQCLSDINSRPVEQSWLEAGNLAACRQSVAEAAAGASALSRSRQAIEQRYSEEVWALDADGLAERFTLYESSWWRRTFNSGADRKRLREHLRDSGDRTDWRQLQEDVQHLKTCADGERWFAESNVSHIELFGKYSIGPTTDWTELIALLEAVEVLNGLMCDTGYSPGFRHALSSPAEDAPTQSSAAELGQKIRRCAKRLRQLAVYFLCQSFDAATEDTVGTAGVEEMQHWAEDHLSHFDDLEDWLRFRRLRRGAQEDGLSQWLDHFLKNPGHAPTASHLFLKSFCLQWMDEVYDEREILSRFSVEEFERLRDDFAARDLKAIDDAAGRVQRQVAESRGDLRHCLGIGQVAILRRELAKQRRHKPIRQLLTEMPELAQDLTPCMMMSPLTVSQYLGSERLDFDVVLFDEASQVKPEDALAAIMRTSQFILAGDPKQLPPTTFFDSSLEESSDDEVALDALDSILDETGLWLNERLLRWHYRSRDDELIAFSNNEFYENRLVTFPDAGQGDALGVRLLHCPEAVYDRGGTRTNATEAERVADLVVETMHRHSSDSVGIVAFSQAQQNAIWDVFEARAAADSRFESFLSGDDQHEPLFIKNLETVQGDERDTIIISVGYGRDASGRLYMNFGPLNQQGGDRRLNVAVTRARKRVIVVSSMTAQDIDPSAAGGAQLLRRYLDFAARGPDALQTSGAAAAAPDSPFEEAVCAALRDRGITVEPQVGCGPYRIDLGIVDPDQPGRYLLGVECDGRTYHSSRTARDRDRLREQVLRDHGWDLVRIWSTDWWRHPQRQIERVLAALETARRERADAAASRTETEQTEEAPAHQDQRGDDGAPPAETEALLQDLQAQDELTDPDYGFSSYVPVQLGELGNQEAFYRMAETRARYLQERIRLVVAAEAPVHFDVAMKRVTEAYGISRCGSRIQGLMGYCVAAAESNGAFVRRGDFLWSPGTDEIQVRTNEGSPTPRHISEFALAEIALAIRTVVEIAHGAPTDDVTREVARALGFGRTGKDIQERIGEAAALALEHGYIEQVGDELLPPQ